MKKSAKTPFMAAPDRGLREAHIIDDDGFIWVPDIPL